MHEQWVRRGGEPGMGKKGGELGQKRLEKKEQKKFEN